MSLRAKFIITSILLLLVIISSIYSADITAAAWHNYQQESLLVKSKDVRTIRPWMSLSYISHTYHIPENNLYLALHISRSQNPHIDHTSLVVLAQITKHPISQVIRNVQQEITSYRKYAPFVTPHIPRKTGTPTNNQHIRQPTPPPKIYPSPGIPPNSKPHIQIIPTRGDTH